MALRTSLEVEGVVGLPPDADGKPVGWSMWHCMRLADAIQKETGTDDVPFPDEYVFKESHLFVEEEQNVWTRGGEPGQEYRFAVPAGAIYRCWRDR